MLRLGRRERAEVVLRRAAGPPPRRAVRRRARAGSTSCDSTSNGDGRAPVEDAVAVRARPRRVARVEVGRGLLDRHDGDLVGQARVQRLGGAVGRRAALDVADATWPSACTPESVRPADRERVVRRERRRRARLGARPRPSVVPAATAQPWNGVPSYSIVILTRTSGSPDATCQDCLMLYLFAHRLIHSNHVTDDATPSSFSASSRRWSASSTARSRRSRRSSRSRSRRTNSRYAFIAGLATSLGAAVSMGFSEGLSDTGELTGRGSPIVRGTITGGGTFLGGILHSLPFLIPHYHAALFFAIARRRLRAHDPRVLPLEVLRGHLHPRARDRDVRRHHHRRDQSLASEASWALTADERQPLTSRRRAAGACRARRARPERIQPRRRRWRRDDTAAAAASAKNARARSARRRRRRLQRFRRESRLSGARCAGRSRRARDTPSRLRRPAGGRS